jgi:hypothetical protein
MHTDTDTLHFLDDESDTGVAAGLVWRLMVIDDEPDVHRATTFALAGVKILGRPLQFLHAYSAAEATELLGSTWQWCCWTWSWSAKTPVWLS